MTAAKKNRTRPAAAPAGTPDPLLEGLNQAQLRAVTHGSGPLLIVAGAGTGKTTVIARRAAWLMANGRAKPEEVLALTFTDKAANEMAERIDALLPLGYADLWVSTFHAFCERLLKAHGLDMGLPDDFRLLNETDAYLLVRRNLDKFGLVYYRPLGNPAKFIHALLKHFSRAKDEAILPQDYLEYAKKRSLDKDDASIDADDASRLSELANAYHVYQKLLLDNGCLDLGDLLLYTLQLFKKRPAILEKYRKQFKHVIVDEFQDTNWSQYELIKMLAPRDGNVVVVGDDDQSIYKFRGASVSNILQFKNDFPSAKEIVLTENYRTRQRILDLAYDFIQLNNPNRLEARLGGPDGSGLSKRLKAVREGDSLVEHRRYASLEDEAAGVVDRIQELKDREPELTWSDFCILVRSNSTADAYSDELRRRGLPFQFLALKGLYAKPIVLDCLAYFKLLDDYHESPALYRVLSSPPYRIEGEDLINLNHEARRKGESLYDVLRRHETIRLKPETHKIIDRLLGHIASHTQTARERSVSEVLIKFLYDSGYAAELKREDTAEAREQASHLNQFLARIRRFEAGHDDPSLKHFMEEYQMERDAGEAGSLAFDVDAGPDMVRIMTVHAAKGLEFTYVFVVDLADKRFPAVDRGGEIELPDALTKEIVPEGDIHLEEERRLFYVAMTRAKDGLVLTSAEDYGGKTKRKPSRFLAELGLTGEETKEAVAGLPAAPAEPEKASRPVYELPDHFSFTQLAAYDSCPLQYKFAHVLRIPVFGRPQFSFGKTMHATLEKFMAEYARRRGTVQPSLFGAPAAPDGSLPVSREELMKMYEESWQDDWYPDRPTKDKYRQKGREILSQFYDKLAAEPADPLLLEKDFKIRIGAFWLKGKIDRIDRAADGVEILDYKTGKAKEDAKLRPEDKRQLLLYQLAAGAMGFKPAKLTYYYLDDGSKISFLGKPEDLEKFEEGTAAQIERIRSGIFEPTPGMQCKFCDFSGICEFRD